MSDLYMQRKRFVLILLLFYFTFSNPTVAQPTLVFQPVISSGLSAPIDFVNAGDGTNRIFIVQQGGIIRIYNSSFGFIGTFLTVTGIVSGGEQGLLTMAFHPDYENPNPAIGGFFYVYYTNSAGDLELARYHVSADPNVADPASKVVILTIPHPTNENHNGGKLNFGTDGYLYFATGDGGSGGDPPNNAQRGDVLLGKMLRINVTNSAIAPFYTIPPGNPYAGPGDPLDEIWAFGLRNPFRWSFDRLNQNMWIGDVGQAAREEINYRAAGTTGGINYGWRCYEGNLPYNTTGCGPIGNYVFPVYDYPNPMPGSAAVTGGVVYRGSNFPALQGYYLAADVYSANVYLINAASFTTTVQSGLPGLIVCFGESENGEVYAVSLGGTVYNVTTAIIVSARLIRFTVSSRNGIATLSWRTAIEQNLKQFEIEYSADGISFYQAGIVQAMNDPNGATYKFEHTAFNIRQVFYRLRMVDFDNNFEYSTIVNVSFDTGKGTFVYPSVITTGIINIFINEPWQKAEVVNMNGAVIRSQKLNGQRGSIGIPVNSAAGGIYLVCLKNNERIMTQKIVIR